MKSDYDGFQSNFFPNLITEGFCSAGDAFKKAYGEKYQGTQFERLLAVRDLIIDISPAIFDKALSSSKLYKPKLKEKDKQSLQDARDEGFAIDTTIMDSDQHKKLMLIIGCLNAFKSISAGSEEEIITKILNDPFGKVILSALTGQLEKPDMDEIKLAGRVLEEALFSDTQNYPGFLIGAPPDFKLMGMPEVLFKASPTPTLRLAYTSALQKVEKKLEELGSRLYKKQGHKYIKTSIGAPIAEYKILDQQNQQAWIVELTPGRPGNFFRSPEPAILSVLTEKHIARKTIDSFESKAGFAVAKTKPLYLPRRDSDGSVNTKISAGSFFRDSLDNASISTNSTSVSSLDNPGVSSSFSSSADITKPLPASLKNSYPKQKIDRTILSSNDFMDQLLTQPTLKKIAFQSALLKAGNRFLPSNKPREIGMGAGGYKEIRGPVAFKDTDANVAYVLNFNRQPGESPNGPTEPVFVQVPVEVVKNIGLNQSVHITVMPDNSLKAETLAESKKVTAETKVRRQTNATKIGKAPGR